MDSTDLTDSSKETMRRNDCDNPSLLHTETWFQQPPN